MTELPNLLPLAYRRRRALRQIVLAWSLVYGVLLLAGGMCWLWQWRVTARGQAVLAQHEQRAQPVQQTHERTLQIRKEIAALGARWESLRQLQPDDDFLQTLGAIAAAMDEFGDGARLQSAVYTPSEPPKEGDRDAAGRSATVDLRIAVEDDLAAAALVRCLKRSPRLRDVTLKAADRPREGGRVLTVVLRALGSEDFS